MTAAMGGADVVALILGLVLGILGICACIGWYVFISCVERVVEVRDIYSFIEGDSQHWRVWEAKRVFSSFQCRCWLGAVRC